MAGVAMGKRIPVPDTTWGKAGCDARFGAALVLTLGAMLLNMRSVWRYVRHGDMP